MLGISIPAVLADLDDDGKLRAGSTLKPKFCHRRPPPRFALRRFRGALIEAPP